MLAPLAGPRRAALRGFSRRRDAELYCAARPAAAVLRASVQPMHEPSASADLIVSAAWLIPVEPSESVLRDQAVVIRDGLIAQIVDRDAADAMVARERVHLADHALLPGLINAHGHAAMSLLRGYADDVPLKPWLERHIWPAEARHVSPEFVRDGTALAMAEMLLAGTTTFSDMYFFPDVVAELARQTGLRCQLAAPVIDFPSAWGRGADEYISKALRLRDECRGRPRISVAFGPHALYTLSADKLETIATYAAELDMAVQIHLHETAGEVLAAIEAHGERPIDTLRRIGLLGPRTQCVHMTDLNEQDIATLAETGAQVVHCPQSNMKLASGACPVGRLSMAGVNVALGTDGAASNNDLNLFNEMHSAALLAKLSSGDAALMSAARTLHLATAGGARALGIEHLTGSITPGKQADLIAVDLSGPATQPLYRPISQLVYACSGAEVTHSWVSGTALMQNRKLLTLDLEATLARAREWGRRIGTCATH